MPIGYLVSVALMACCSAFALAPLRRPRTLGLLSWWLGLVINELPFVAFYWILAATLLAFGEGDIDTAGGWVVFSLAVPTATGLGVIAWRGWRAGAAVEGALKEGLGMGWRSSLDPEIAARLRRRLPWFRILFLPIFVRRRDVERLPTSVTATRAGGTSSISIAHVSSRLLGRRWCICTGAVSSAGGRAGRPVLCPTVSRARVGCASAPTTG